MLQHWCYRSVLHVWITGEGSDGQSLSPGSQQCQDRAMPVFKAAACGRAPLPEETFSYPGCHCLGIEANPPTSIQSPTLSPA